MKVGLFLPMMHSKQGDKNERLLAVLLTLIMLLSICSCFAFAEADEDPYVIDVPKIGFRFVTPEEFRNLKDTLDWSVHYLDDGILQITFQRPAGPFPIA